MTSFLVTWSSNLYILWNLSKAISLQSFSSVDCLGQVLQRDHKNTMMTPSKFQYFVKVVISNQPAKFQIPKLFDSNFKTPQNTIMTSFHNIWLSKLHIL